jgi:hypothetical protein
MNTECDLARATVTIAYEEQSNNETTDFGRDIGRVLASTRLALGLVLLERSTGP